MHCRFEYHGGQISNSKILHVSNLVGYIFLVMEIGMCHYCSIHPFWSCLRHFMFGFVQAVAGIVSKYVWHAVRSDVVKHRAQDGLGVDGMVCGMH